MSLEIRATVLEDDTAKSEEEAQYDAIDERTLRLTNTSIPLVPPMEHDRHGAFRTTAVLARQALVVTPFCNLSTLDMAARAEP